MTERFETDAAAVDWIIGRLGRDLRVALPLGLGKPVTLINALVQRACADPTIRLRIFTALTLERPRPSSDMERRFLEPAMDRLFGAYPQVDYARMLREGTLPGNIEVTEFFLQAGAWRDVARVQQNYVSANYTHALDVLLDQRPNLVLQLVAARDDRLSLSCNTDITRDLLDLRAQGAVDFAFVGQVHPELPFMPGPAEIDAAECAALVHGDAQHELFSVVKRPVGVREHAIGLHVSRLVRDGGTLQIGIGEIGDAVAHALILRQQGKVAPIWASCPFPVAEGFSETGPFQTGLYGVTEMLVGGMLALFEAGVIRREVDGVAIHAGFFLDTRDFYARLRGLSDEQMGKIAMMPVSFTNALYGGEEAKRAARQDARFVNAAMMVTLLGSVVSDATEDGQVVSGVGGQFNFVDQAFALKGARAVLTLPSTRTGAKGATSNIRWAYGHSTIPRHLRDVVVTEYGIADLRGKSDADTIAALLAVTDSRFQAELADKAKLAGKLPRGWQVPEGARNNRPEVLREWLAGQGGDVLPDFPFGTDFNAIERRLLPALGHLRDAGRHWTGLAGLILGGLRGAPVRDEDAALDRMDLRAPQGLKARLSALALKGALRAVG